MAGSLEVKFKADPAELFGLDDQSQMLAQAPIAGGQMSPQMVDQQQQPQQQQQIAPSANLPDRVKQPMVQQPMVELPQAMPVADPEIASSDLSLGQPQQDDAQSLVAQQVMAAQQPQEPTSLQQQLRDKIGEDIQRRRSDIDRLKSALGQAEARPAPINTRAINAFIDQMFPGGNLVKNLGEPKETAAQRENRLNLLRRAISQEQGALTNAQIDQLKTFADASGNSELRKDMRFLERQQDKFKLDFYGRRKDLAKEVNRNGLPGLNVTFNEMDKAIKGGVDGWDGKANIPGIGGADALLPTAKLSQPGRRVRQLTLALGNQILKLRSGAQINEQEAIRILGELGFDQALLEGGGTKLLFKGTRSDQDWINGVRDAKDNMRRVENVLRAGYGEDAWEAVRDSFRKSTRKVKAKPGPKNLEPASKMQGLSEEDLENMSEEELDAYLAE